MHVGESMLKRRYDQPGTYFRRSKITFPILGRYACEKHGMTDRRKTCSTTSRILQCTLIVFIRSYAH
jgi:hypothetical protein